jgi:carbonic anhydrase
MFQGGIKAFPKQFLKSKQFNYSLLDFLGTIGKHDTQQTIDKDYKEYSRLLSGNQKYVEEKTATDKDFFKRKAELQRPKYMLIGCSDSRVPPNELTKTEPGEIFIHRNVANVVVSSDVNCMSTIQFAVEYLKVEHIIVMGHTKCGGVIAATKYKHLGLIDQWLQHIRDVAVKNKALFDHIKEEEQFIKKLIEVNVVEQAINVCKTSYVQKAWSQGNKLQVHGWVCDIDTGLIDDLRIGNNEWKNVEKYFKYEF